MDPSALPATLPESRETTQAAPPASPRLGLWTLLGLIGLVAATGLYPGFWETWAGWLPLWNAVEPAALANVAVTPDLWRGAGMGAIAPVEPLLLLGIAPAVAVKWVLLSTAALGALACYTWLAPLFGDRGGALGASLWLLLPMHLSGLFVRGDLAAALTVALLPMALAGQRALAAESSWLGAGVVTVATLWMWRAQAGMAAVVTLLLLLHAGLVLRHRLALLLAVGVGAAGLLSVAGLSGLTAEPAVPFYENFISIYGLLRLEAAPGEPIQIGAAAFALAVVGLFALWAGDRVPDGEQLRLLIFSAVATLLLAALALPWSAPLWQVTRAARLFTWPWSPLLLAGPLLAALAAATPALFSELSRTALWVTMVGALLLIAQPALAPAYTQVEPPDRPLAIVGAGDLALLSATVEGGAAEAGKAATATLSMGWQVLRTPSFDENLFFQAVDESGETPRVVAQLDVSPLADRPATSWRSGELLNGTWTLTLPDEAADPNALVFYAGFYDWRDGARRSISMGGSLAAVGAADKLILLAEAPHGE